jgi:hypothetical protein
MMLQEDNTGHKSYKTGWNFDEKKGIISATGWMD